MKLIKVMDFESQNESNEYIDVPPISKKSVICNKDDIIIARTGTLGLVLTNVVGVFHNNTFAIDYDREIFDKMFFYYFLQSPRVQLFIKIISTRTSQADLTHREFSRLILYIPPIGEQRKIASIISKIDALIQILDQLIEQIQTLKKGLKQRLFSKGIAHTSFKKTDAGEIPEEWNVAELGKGLNLCQYGLSLKLSECGEYPTFRMNNIENGYMISNKMKFLDLDKDIFERYKLEKGDLLFNRTNSSDLVGKIGLFMLDGNYTFASYLIRLRAKTEMLDSFFLNFYLNTDFMQYKLKSLATPGVSQVNINAENLKSVSVPIPPIEEQQQIVSILSNIDKRKQVEISLREKVSNLKKGLVQKLLTGEIRVKI